jgi:hypothetical protein
MRSGEFSSPRGGVGGMGVSPMNTAGTVVARLVVAVFSESQKLSHREHRGPQ